MAPEARPACPPVAPRTPFLARWGAACASAALLVGMVAVGGASVRPADAEETRARIKSMADRYIPFSVGDWLGRNVEAPPAAVALLRPNVLESRAYTNSRTGETASLLFLHCGDARDLLGHYPPVCYVAHGKTLVAAEPRDWRVGRVEIRGMRYRFTGEPGLGSSGVVVDNFMVIPTRGYGRDMDDVTRVAEDPRTRLAGVAEVQVLTDAAMDDERRDEVFETLVEKTLPLLEYVGVEPGHD